MRSVKTQINVNDMAACNPVQAGAIAFRLVSDLSYRRREECAVGFALAFKTYCEQHNIHVGEALAVAERMMQVDGHLVTELRALKMFLKEQK